MHVRVTGSPTCVHVNLLSCCIHCLDHSIRCHYSWMWDLSLSPLSISLSSCIPPSPLSSSPPHPSLLSLSLSLSSSVPVPLPSPSLFLSTSPLLVLTPHPLTRSLSTCHCHAVHCCTFSYVIRQDIPTWVEWIMNSAFIRLRHIVTQQGNVVDAALIRPSNKLQAHHVGRIHA